tara:strand:+ start:3019 stop:3393 length:375 start_codon:yes stop_codon:yes gene_type:complete
MKITKRQLKRIIREEYSRLKRRGLIKESFQDNHAGTASAEFSAVCLDMGMNMGEVGRMGKLYDKVDHCFARMEDPAKCASQLSPQEQGMFMEDFQQCLAMCQNSECQAILEYAMDVEMYIGGGY